MPSFDRFDRRHYTTTSVPAGYGAWAPTYESTVEDCMDLALLNRIASVPWDGVTRAADLGCGSGRTASWLRTIGPFPIDGVDITPEMLQLARTRGVHDRLVHGDVRSTGLDTGAYDLVVCCLVDEHLPDLGPLYEEARRLLVPPATFVMVGFHPFFIMSTGMPTHFDSTDGDTLAIETHVHLLGEHMAAAGGTGFQASELHEQLVDDEFIRLKPSWEACRDWPFSYAWVWSLP